MTIPDQNRIPRNAEAVLEERKKRILNVKTLVFLIVSVFIAYFLLGKLDIAKTWDSIRNADAVMVIVSCLVYSASNFFKMLRFRLMLGDYGIPLFDLYAITSYHNFYNQIMPARTGELTFVYYLKKIGNADVSKGLHILVVTRIFDFIVISAFFICSIIFVFGARTSMALIAAGAAFFIISIIALFNLKWIVILCGRILRTLTKNERMQKNRLVGALRGRIDVLVHEFSSFKTARFVPALAVTSILTWSALYFLFYLTIRSFGIDIGLIQSVAGSTGGVLTNVLPINSFGSFGTLEAGWTGGFILVGMSEQDAIFTGFGYHFISFFASAAIALFCYVVTIARKG
ncbi:MAG: hypothetical protein A2W19_16435 [Spirochaetes bacterium RBG_16_49_21]|nr:MAG: hypothetical protein A2W19_16435 [Spirochaetes bacterium RBG_16_49_21]